MGFTKERDKETYIEVPEEPRGIPIEKPEGDPADPREVPVEPERERVPVGPDGEPIKEDD